MILLDKKVSISRLTKPGLIMLISVFLGCEKAEDLGIQYPLESNVNVKYKEFVLPSTNIYIDSLRTDQGNLMIVGDFSDPLTGNIKAEGYFQYSFLEGTLPTVTQDIYVSGGDSLKFANPQDTLSVDSLVLELEVSTTLPSEVGELSFELSELVSNLQSSVVYLSSSQQSKQNVLGNYNGIPKTIASDTTGRKSIRIKFSEAETSKFFQLVSDIIQDSTQLLTSYEFNNLALSSLPENVGLVELLKVSDFSNLTLYMDDIDDDSIYTALFPISGTHYSYLERDKSGTDFEGITEKSDFDLSDGRTLIEPLAGLSIAFSVDEISDFFDEEKNIIINSANFIFEIESTDERDTLSTFAGYRRKSDNGFFASAIASQQSIFSGTIVSDASFLGSSIAPSVSQIKQEGEVTIFTLGCTQYFNSVFNEFQESGSLQFQSPFEETPRSISEFVLISMEEDDVLHRTIFKNDGIKLRIYYTELID